MKKILLLLIIFLLTAITTRTVLAQDVGVGIYVINLGKFDIATGSFTADFYLSMNCNSVCISEDFEFMNGRATSVDKIINKPNEKFYRIQANLNSPINLKRFPFDTQRMQILIEDKIHPVNEIRYVPMKKESGIDSSIVFTGWNIDEWEAVTNQHEYGVYDEVYSQYIFNINISRIVVNSFIKTFLPIIFIVLVALFTFLLDPDKIAIRLTLLSSSLISAVMFNISITNQIPPVGYLTFADKFMMLTYFILLVSFVITVVLLQLFEMKKNELVERLHRTTEYSMFIITPILYINLFVFFI